MLLLISRRDYWQYRNNNIYNDCHSIEYFIGANHSHWIAGTGSILHIMKLLQFHCAIEKRHYVVWWIIFITHKTLRCHCIKIDSANSHQRRIITNWCLLFKLMTSIELKSNFEIFLEKKWEKSKPNSIVLIELMAQLASSHHQSALSQSHLILSFLKLQFFSFD